MAGNFENNGFKKAGRKKWTLFRGSRGLFQRVGTEMAEDGCPDAQFNLANELLKKHCDSPSEEEENAREGIYWLIKASEQGHGEATVLLKECLETGKGITEHNISEVLECLETTTNEKLSVKAIRYLFMNFSEGEEFITSNQLLTKLKEVEKSDNRADKLPQIEARKSSAEDWKERADHLNGQKLTEDVLVSAARTYARGELPDIGQSLVLPERNICRLKSINTVYRILLFPVILNRLYSYLLSFNPRVITSLLYISPVHIKILLILFVYSTFKFEAIFSSLPTVLYYLSFFVMIAATCQMLKYRKRFRQFRCWSNLFLQYGGENFSPQEAEFLHCRNGLPAYGSFFMFLLVNLFVQSLTSVNSFFRAEITFVAFLFTITTLLSFTFSRSRYISSVKGVDFLGLFSFMLHVLAKYPYETDSVVGVGWRFLDLQVPTFASYVVGHGIEFCLNFRAFFYLLIPAVLVKMAARHNWRGIYSDLIPHCVTLSWWQLTLIYAQDATWYSLIRPALALAGIIFFLPLTALASIFLPVYALAEYIFVYENLWTVAITFALAFGLPLFILKKIISQSPRILNLFTVFQILITIIAAGFLLFQSNLNFISDFKKSITDIHSVEVTEFASYCSSFQTPYTDAEKMETQFQCSQMLGMPIYWKGKVKETKISNIHNPISTVVRRLPTFLAKYIHCALGEEYPLCSSSFRVAFCKTLSSSCHLSNWNRYEFKISVDVNVDDGNYLPVVLVANNQFHNFTRKLNAGDDVWFSGTITGDENGIINSIQPRVELSSITCISCLESELTEATSGLRLSPMYLYNFIKYLLNFFFNPLIVFR